MACDFQVQGEMLSLAGLDAGTVRYIRRYGKRSEM